MTLFADALLLSAYVAGARPCRTCRRLAVVLAVVGLALLAASVPAPGGNP